MHPHFYFNPFPKQQILDASKPKEFADDNFKFDLNGRKFTKLEENTVGKGEIARDEQFLLFSQCFQKTSSADKYKPGLVWERIKYELVLLSLTVGHVGIEMIISLSWFIVQ